MGARRVGAQQLTDDAAAGSVATTRPCSQTRVLLRGTAKHALGERGGLQSAGLPQLDHVGVEPDGT
eukprot:1979532-Prymnesium_polylepis.1